MSKPSMCLAVVAIVSKTREPRAGRPLAGRWVGVCSQGGGAIDRVA
jgi:hypothetical protein